VRHLIAVLACASLVAGCGSRWPRVTAVSSPELASAATPLATIDILPVDLEVWTDKRVWVDVDEVRTGAETRLIGIATEMVYQRGYAVGAVLDWGGGYVAPDGNATLALDEAQLVGTVDSLASYGAAVSAAGELPFPYLPARLGERTGSDATLYIGGWGFVGVEHETAKTIGKVVLVAVLIVGVIAIAMAVGKDRKLERLGGAAAKGAARVMVSAGRAALRAGTAVVHVGREVAVHADAIAETTAHVLDAFGRTATHITLVGGRPARSEDAALPHRGSPRMYLEMTLVDNRTGVVRWHAHQRFPANPARPGDVTRAARALLATLPRQAAATVR